MWRQQDAPKEHVPEIPQALAPKDASVMEDKIEGKFILHSLLSPTIVCVSFSFVYSSFVCDKWNMPPTISRAHLIPLFI